MQGRILERSDPQFSKALERLQQGKQDMSDTRARHTCSTSVCNPQSEPQLYGFQNCISTNVYLCKFGSIHVCTIDSCTLYRDSHERTCPISGIQHGQDVSMYDKNNSRTWNLKLEHVYHGTAIPPARGAGGIVATRVAEPPARSAGGFAAPPSAETPALRPAAARGGEISDAGVSAPPLLLKRRGVLPKDEELEARASTIVDLLLFSNARIARNNQAIKDMQAEADAACLTYSKRRMANGQYPFWTDVYRLTGHFLSKPLPLTIFERNVGLHDYYVAIIMQVWKRVQMFLVPQREKKYDEQHVEIVPRVDFEQVCLSAMYTMRQGMHVNGLILLPKDDFLLLHLPVARDLSYFKLDKTCISKGDKIITTAYENAFKGGASALEMQINLNELPVYRNEEEELEWVAGANVPAKRSVEGNLLFMPQARSNSVRAEPPSPRASRGGMAEGEEAPLGRAPRGPMAGGREFSALPRAPRGEGLKKENKRQKIEMGEI